MRQPASIWCPARDIFRIEDPAVLIVVQELGFANLTIGTLGVLSLFQAGWIPAAALAGGLFYALAGIRHLLKNARNSTETIAMVSDLLIAAVLAADLASRLLIS